MSSIKLELEKHEWEAVVRLIHQERETQGRQEYPLLSDEGWSLLLNRLLDAGIEQALALPEDQEMREMFNFLVQDNEEE
jgi:hypothetical protein